MSLPASCTRGTSSLLLLGQGQATLRLRFICSAVCFGLGSLLSTRLWPRHQRHLALKFCMLRSLVSVFEESRALGCTVSFELLFLLGVAD